MCNNKLFTLFFLSFILLFACQRKPVEKSGTAADAQEDGKLPLVVTTIGPYKFLLGELGGNSIEVLNTSETSGDPHTVDLTPQQAWKLKDADIFLSLNPEEESLLLKSLGDRTKIVEMWHGFPLLSPAHRHDKDGHDDDHKDEHHDDHKDEHDDDHDDGHHDEHDDEHDDRQETEGWNEHFWLNPTILKIQIETMAKELTILVPENREQIEANKLKLLQDCENLAEQLRVSLPELQNGKIFSFHSALSYFANFFDAKEVYIESQGIEMGADEILHLFEEVEDLTYPVLIYSPQFQQEKAKSLAHQLKLELLEFDPQIPDVFTNIANLAEQLSKARN
ncbi:zinc ABC transporter substrate-binding protein [Candidatus Haliotispira prima]|uniref:Zinc ABC transporter substrate-binding protein n=1 Tax=Candidatus Haliotispira prima TaxID=3034016 RepID=A0ABY8MHR3_9SPIO|nr:zinc ABC transporter substrate-binding protein [Candidatus Haliotispira prima]